MLTRLIEVAWVLQHSTRTQLALMAAFVSFFGMLLLGNHMAGDIEFSGPLAALTDPFREVIAHRYEKAAWMLLFGFLGLAMKNFFRARRRLLQY